MKRILLSFTCVGLSAMLLAGCANTNHNLNARSLQRGNIVHQNAESPDGRFGTNQGMNSGGRGMANDHDKVSNNATKTRTHVLQLGNWMRIVGGRDEAGARFSTNRRTDGVKGPGIARFEEKSADQSVTLTVNDPKAIEAIDRINDILSSGSIGSRSDTLIHDLAYVLQSAAGTSGTNPHATGATGATGR